MPGELINSMEPYKDPCFLSVAYWGRRQSISQIASVCGVSSPTISHYMEKYEIERRPTSGIDSVSVDAYLEDIKSIIDKLEYPISSVEYEKHGNYSRTLYRRKGFDDWMDVVDAANELDA